MVNNPIPITFTYGEELYFHNFTSGEVFKHSIQNDTVIKISNDFISQIFGILD